MNNTPDFSYFDSAIDDIVSHVGMNKKLEEGVIFREFRKTNITTCIEYVANYLNLPIKVNLTYIPSDHNIDGHDSAFAGNSSAAQRIAAQVMIPPDLPLYGSSQFQGFPITVKVTDNCFDYPETFFCIMAHELSHVVLHSLWHREKNNEIYTDLTAMVLGFSDIMKKGRKNNSVRQNDNLTETATSTYGYLSDSQFNFSYQKINKLLAEYISIEESCKSEYLKSCEISRECKRRLERLPELLQLIDKKQKTRMKQEDALVIVKMHEPGYFEEIRSVIGKTENQLNDIQRITDNIHRFNSKTLITLNDCINQTRYLSIRLNETLNQINLGKGILEKYQGLFVKIQKGILKEDSGK